VSRPAQPFTAEVVEVVEGAWVAIWSRLLPAEPVPGPAEAATYVKADDAQALEKARAEAVAHAQAKLQTWNRFWSLGQHSTPEKERWYAERAAREAERAAAAAAERAALTSDEIAAEEAEVAAGWAAWEAQKDRERDEQIAKRIAEADAEIDAVEGPGAGARRRAERDASYQRWVDSLAAEDAECERRQRELDEEYGPEEEPQAANGHVNGHEFAFRPPERVTPVSEPPLAASTFTREPEPEPDDLDGEPTEVDLAAIPREPDPHTFIVEDWLPDGVVTLFAAHGGAGKSYIALYIAICVASGHGVLQAAVARRRVVFYSCEDDRTTLGFRVRKYCDMLRIDPASLTGWLTLLDATSADNVLYTGDARIGERLTPRFSWLQARVAAADAGLLVLDNASDAYDGNENERGKVRQFLTALRRVAPATLLLAHVDAVTSQQKNVGDGKGYSGSTGWHNSVRCRWEGGGKRPGEMDLLLAKSNYGPTNLFASFKFDKLKRVWVVGEVRARMVDSTESMLPVLRLVKAYLGAGHALSESLFAPNGPAAILKLDGAPRGLKPKDVAEVLMKAAQRGYLRVEVTRVDSKERRRYTLTDQGSAFTVGGEHTRAAS
jgi:hypothetical protein